MSRPPIEKLRWAVRHPDQAASSVLHRITQRESWLRQGPYVTFQTDGFVYAPSPPLLLARHNYELAYIHTALSGRTVERSLEIGCGFGRLSPAFSAHSAQHVAVDINASALSQGVGCYPDLAFFAASATSLPFRDKSFDLVSTWTVLQHLRAELIDSAIAEVDRVLQPDGIVLLCEATRFPDVSSEHTWDRHRSFYANAFAPRRLTFASYIDELDAIPGLSTPGEVLRFEP